MDGRVSRDGGATWGELLGPTGAPLLLHAVVCPAETGRPARWAWFRAELRRAIGGLVDFAR